MRTSVGDQGPVGGRGLRLCYIAIQICPPWGPTNFFSGDRPGLSSLVFKILYLIWFLSEFYEEDKKGSSVIPEFCMGNQDSKQNGWLIHGHQRQSQDLTKAFQGLLRSSLGHAVRSCEGEETTKTIVPTYLEHLHIPNNVAQFQFWSVCAWTTLAPK